jgi:hypothetical protein
MRSAGRIRYRLNNLSIPFLENCQQSLDFGLIENFLRSSHDYLLAIFDS